MVKFKLNKSLDKTMSLEFLFMPMFAGVDFGKAIWSYHPKLKNQKDSKYIYNYFDEYYKENNSKLVLKCKLFQNQWDKVEKQYINEVTKLFNGFSFPKGKYIGYLSTYDCNPRFLDTKCFQLFYKANSSVATTAHELMHFIFYAYTSEYFSDIVKNLNPNDGLWWDVAEVFNTVILTSNSFESLLGSKENSGYPD
ncbi:MAG: hypothetical protein WCK31_04875, partial [bacterium]